jgi:hypothetical protein
MIACSLLLILMLAVRVSYAFTTITPSHQHHQGRQCTCCSMSMKFFGFDFGTTKVLEATTVDEELELDANFTLSETASDLVEPLVAETEE